MKRKHHIIPFILAMFVLSGCTSKSVIQDQGDTQNNEPGVIAYVSASEDSAYAKTFKDLNLGTILDFQLKELQANQSWINLWVEGYQNGEPIEPNQVITLSYGLGLEPIVESNIGFALIKFENKIPRAFLYSASAVSSSIDLPENLLNPAYMSAWRSALSSESVSLEYGEEILLGYYLNSEITMFLENKLHTDEAIRQMIDSHENVLLLKLRIDQELEDKSGS